MARIIDKIVVSTTAPTNKNTMWIKPLGNMKYSIFLFVNNTWSSVGSSSSTAPAGYEETDKPIEVYEEIEEAKPLNE